MKRSWNYWLIVALAIPLTTLFLYIASAQGADNDHDAQKQSEVDRELFDDLRFERGFKIIDIARKPRALGTLNLTEPMKDEDDASGAPAWGLAQHNSKYDLTRCDVRSEGSARFVETPSQRVALSTNVLGENVLTLRVSTDQEYASPRRANEPWIHLLLTYDFPKQNRVAFKDVDSLIFSCDARVADWKRLQSVESYDSNIHATQASVYFAIPNGKPGSEDLDDYIWFGVSFFDDRYEVQSSYVALDGDPKTIGTGKLIYRLGDQKTIDTILGGVNPYSGDWAHIEFDLKRYLPEALAAAQKRGLLTHSEPDDFVIAHFNFGWETPGVYESTLEIKNLHLRARMSEGQ